MTEFLNSLQLDGEGADCAGRSCEGDSGESMPEEMQESDNSEN